MSEHAQVTFQTEKALLIVEGATQEGLAALAFWIEGQTKANIQGNGQIDTGFMLNSVYTVAKNTNTVEQTWADGTYTSRKTGQSVSRHKGPQAQPGEAAAVVAVGANYAIFQEEKKSFLYKAGRQAVQVAKSILEPVFQKRIG